MTDLLQAETDLVRGTREAIERMGPELARLERLRDDIRRQLAGARETEASGGKPEDSPAFLSALLKIQEHGIQGIEEGWVELDDCFSEAGIARLRRKARSARPRRKAERSGP